METPIKMDDLEGNTPIFGNTHLGKAGGCSKLMGHPTVAFVSLAFFNCSFLSLKQFQKMTGVPWVTLEGLQPFQYRSCAVPDADVGGG